MSKEISEAKKRTMRSLIALGKRSKAGHKWVKNFRFRQECASQDRRKQAYMPGSKRK